MREPPSIATIIEVVARQCRIPVAGILSPRRDRYFARPRQIAMWVARNHAYRELAVIGRAFGRDHTTVLHACRLVERLMREDGAFAGQVWACVQAVDFGESVDARRAMIRSVA